MDGVPTVIPLVRVITPPPHKFEMVAVKVIIPLLIFINVVCGELGVFIVTIPAGVTVHCTVVPAGRLGTEKLFEVVQTTLSPLTDKPALPA